MTILILALIAAILLFGAGTALSAARRFLLALGLICTAVALGFGVRALTGSDLVAFLLPVGVLLVIAVWAKGPVGTTATASVAEEWSPEEQLRLAQGSTLSDLQARSKRP
ncbi:hypothetical protein [Inquilinus limosus]|uniref:Uncharacterized protein n=1 Tax=Inquilinus limosus MP06 TaxID=1398085 RepID=A0A0A0DCA0_9PROT|nr:hypothetical protein [Inquilinus limosus]KGM35739.1 hypothetical protein P409_02895 [Inquilinus limosus MP06]